MRQPPRSVVTIRASDCYRKRRAPTPAWKRIHADSKQIDDVPPHSFITVLQLLLQVRARYNRANAVFITLPIFANYIDSENNPCYNSSIQDEIKKRLKKPPVSPRLRVTGSGRRIQPRRTAVIMTLSFRICQPRPFFAIARTGDVRLLQCRQQRYRLSMEQDLARPKWQQRLTAGIACLFLVCRARLAPFATAAFLLSCACLGTPSHAGTYTVSYSGGAVSSMSGSTAAFSLQQSGWTGGASASGYSSASVQVNGPITATFNWHADPSLPADPPPTSVIVTEHCTANGDGYAYISCPTASANDGFGDQATYLRQDQTSVTITSTGFRYSVQSGESFTVTCSPTVTVSGTLCSLSASISYMAVVTPVVLSLYGGTVSEDGNKNILIGQGCSGTLTAGNILLGNFLWSVSGDTFKDFVAHGRGDAGVYTRKSRVDFMTSVDWSFASPHWFWRSESGAGSSTETVTCTADVFVDGKKIGTASGGGSLTVWRPDYTCVPLPHDVIIKGGPHFWSSPIVSTGIFTVGGTPPGIQWTGQVLPQALFKITGAGKWAFIQLICSGRMYTDDNNVTHTLSSNGVWALDGSYPYPFWHTLGPPDLPGLDDSNYGDPDDNTPDTTDDTPSSALADDMKTFIVNEKFETYMMYRPKDIGFGCQWVPLHRISWNWFANIFRPGASWSNYDPMPAYLGPVNVTENIRWKQHPLWNIANFADEDTWDP